jgi:hypothetical protein
MRTKLHRHPTALFPQGTSLHDQKDPQVARLALRAPRDLQSLRQGGTKPPTIAQKDGIRAPANITTMAPWTPPPLIVSATPNPHAVILATMATTV